MLLMRWNIVISSVWLRARAIGRPSDCVLESGARKRGLVSMRMVNLLFIFAPLGARVWVRGFADPSSCSDLFILFYVFVRFPNVFDSSSDFDSLVSSLVC
jgi:hypothetical protein